MAASVLSAPVDIASLRLALGDAAEYQLRLQTGYVITAALSLYITGHALERVGAAVRTRDIRPSHRLAVVGVGILLLVKTAAEIWSIEIIAIERFGRWSAFWVNKARASATSRMTALTLADLLAIACNYSIGFVAQLVFIDRLFALYNRPWHKWTIAISLVLTASPALFAPVSRSVSRRPSSAPAARPTRRTNGGSSML